MLSAWAALADAGAAAVAAAAELVEESCHWLVARQVVGPVLELALALQVLAKAWSLVLPEVAAPS